MSPSGIYISIWIRWSKCPTWRLTLSLQLLLWYHQGMNSAINVLILTYIDTLMELLNSNNYAQFLKCCNLVWLPSQTRRKVRFRWFSHSSNVLKNTTKWTYKVSKISSIILCKESNAQQYCLQGVGVQVSLTTMQFLQQWFFPQIHPSS